MTTIYYVGYEAVHPGDFVYDIPNGHDFWLIILTHTPAEFWVNGEIRAYPPNCAVLFPPHQKIYYRACSETFSNDWVRFQSDESFLTETTIPLGVPIEVPDPDYCRKLFHLLATENFFSYDYREMTIDYLLRILLNKMLEAAERNDDNPYYHKLLDLRKRIHNNPGLDWSVAAMAEQVHLSQSYLQQLYKSTFGISCMEDVIQCRIRLAKEQIAYGSQRIADISALCGYANVEHFSRQFRKIVGCSPQAYRNALREQQQEKNSSDTNDEG